MPTYRPGVVFTHPAGPTGFARIVWFYLAGKGSNLVEKFVRVPFAWTDAQIEEECREWCSVHAEEYAYAERLTGDWESVLLFNVGIRCIGMNWEWRYFVVLAPTANEATKRAETRYRYACECYGPKVFERTCEKAD